jgi:hypothetical protein
MTARLTAVIRSRWTTYAPMTVPLRPTRCGDATMDFIERRQRRVAHWVRSGQWAQVPADIDIPLISIRGAPAAARLGGGMALLRRVVPSVEGLQPGGTWPGRERIWVPALDAVELLGLNAGPRPLRLGDPEGRS